MKYLHFKQKMLLMLNKPNVMSALNNKINNNKGVKLSNNDDYDKENNNKLKTAGSYNKEADFNVRVLTMKKNHMIYEDQMKEIFESNEKNIEKKLEIIDNQLNFQTNDIQERLKERRNSIHISG